MIAGVGLEPNLLWAPCCETWLKFEVEVLRCREKKNEWKKNVWVVCYPVSWAPCCETWLKFEVEVLRCREKKNELKKNVWVVCYPVSWAPCCERTKS